MKASHVARLAGHEALGDIISSSRAPPRHSRPHRRRRREGSRSRGGSHRQPGNPGVVLQLLKEVRGSLAKHLCLKGEVYHAGRVKESFSVGSMLKAAGNEELEAE